MLMFLIQNKIMKRPYYLQYRKPSIYCRDLILRPRGKFQMYSLGQRLRSYYTEFLPKYYWPLDVNFTSSYADRCLMSAELVAAGLFPPQDNQIWSQDLLWQPIPIHYLPRNLDNLVAMKTNCTKYDKEFVEAHSYPKYIKINEENQNLYKYLTKHTGMTIDNIEAVESLYNTLEIEELNNLTRPAWVNDTLMAQMKILAAQNLAIYSETEYMKKMKGGFFLRTVLDLMQSYSNDNNVPSVNMYSGHDITIVHIMRALGLADDTMKPWFGAYLIFELYENVIQVLYADSWEILPQVQKLPNCSDPCSIEKFEEGFKSVLPVDWFNECQLT